MKRLIIDLDGTLTLEQSGEDYSERKPNDAVISKLREYRAQGFEIVIATSRNMRTYNGAIGKINAFTLPAVIEWLRQNDVPFDEVHVGKPWCGFDGFYVDDRAIRPSEFVKLEYSKIRELIDDETGLSDGNE